MQEKSFLNPPWSHLSDHWESINTCALESWIVLLLHGKVLFFFAVEMRVPNAWVQGNTSVTMVDNTWGYSGQLWVNAVTQGYSRQQWAILIQGNSVPNASVLLGGKSGHTSDYLLTQFGFSHHLHRYSYFLLLRWDRWDGSNIRKGQCSHRAQRR